MRWLLPLVLVPALAEEPVPPVVPAVPPAPPSATPTAIPVAAEVTADTVLADAITLLAEGEYDQALRVSIPAIAKYPDHAASFRAVADVAADQLERLRASTGAAVTTSTPLPRPVTGLPKPYAYRAPPRAPRHETSLGLGFEVGAPTGFRLELDLDAKKPGGVDAIGIRAGGNTMFYHDVWPVSDTTAFMDFRVNDTWQVEATAGGFVYFGNIYPSVGAALQYDPAGPMFVNAGARLGPYGSWLPDTTAGFVW